MNDQLQGALTKFIEGLISFGQQAASVTGEVVPEVVKQLLLFHTVWFSAVVLLLLVLSLLYVKLFKAELRGMSSSDSEGLKFTLGMCLAGSWLYGIHALYQLLMITLAPYVWLVEYARGWL